MSIPYVVQYTSFAVPWHLCNELRYEFVGQASYPEVPEPFKNFIFGVFYLLLGVNSVASS